jgi:hypothetical protein
MSKRPKVGRALFLTRDSGGEHETTPSEYVLWAQRYATGIGARFSGTPERIEAMIRTGNFEDGDLFLDYRVTGDRLQRPGLDALFRVALGDPTVSHILIPRRDRLARPDDWLDGIAIETKLRTARLTLVFMDRGVLPPLGRGSRDLGETLVGMIDYYNADKERRDLASKMIFAQIWLSKEGFSTGGRPPYGFRRWLVKTDGTRVRQLQEGEYVKMHGHHVVWLPDEGDFALIYRILEMLEKMPACRVAARLTAEGTPSPDAGRERTDGGVRHQVSGAWNQATILAIARNPLLRGVVEHGRRSMGDKLRFSPDGPRELDETADLRADGKGKVVTNPDAIRIKAPASFAPLVDMERHERLLQELDKRAGTQRDKPRSSDRGPNPLSRRIFDMACGWKMSRQPYQTSFRYLCGLYQQSHGARCGHHHVDGLLATRCLLGCIRQRIVSKPTLRKLEERIRAIAERELAKAKPDTVLATKRAALADVRMDLERVGKNLAHAEGEAQYRAVATVFEGLKREEKALQVELETLEQSLVNLPNVESEVKAALAGLDRLADLAHDSSDLGSVGNLFWDLNARMFLRFRKVPWKKRVVNKLASGVITFGATPPPVPIYKGPTGRKHLSAPAADPAAAGHNSHESPYVAGEEGNSLGNVNRGERI